MQKHSAAMAAVAGVSSGNAGASDAAEGGEQQLTGEAQAEAERIAEQALRWVGTVGVLTMPHIRACVHWAHQDNQRVMTVPHPAHLP